MGLGQKVVTGQNNDNDLLSTKSTTCMSSFGLHAANTAQAVISSIIQVGEIESQKH